MDRLPRSLPATTTSAFAASARGRFDVNVENVFVRAEHGTFAITRGCGGEHDSPYAAMTVLDAFLAAARSGEALDTALQRANRQILHACSTNRSLRGACATFTGVIVGNGEAVDDGGFQRGGDRPGGDVALEGAPERVQLAEGLRQGADQKCVVGRGGGRDRGLRQDEAGAAQDALLVLGIDAVDRGDEGREHSGHGRFAGEMTAQRLEELGIVIVPKHDCVGFRGVLTNAESWPSR